MTNKKMTKISRKEEIEKIQFSKNVIAKVNELDDITEEDRENLKDLWTKVKFLEEKFTDPAFKDAPKSSITTAVKLNGQIFSFATLLSASMTPQKEKS